MDQINGLGVNEPSRDDKAAIQDIDPFAWAAFYPKCFRFFVGGPFYESELVLFEKKGKTIPLVINKMKGNTCGFN